MQSSRAHRAAARALLIGASLGFALIAAEVVVRLIRPQPVMTVSRGLYAPDPPRRYRLQPGFSGSVGNQVEFHTRVRLNSLGMRGPEPRSRSSGELAVLALGDSFTFGVGAEQDQTWPARLEARLRQAHIPAQVWNAGAPGYGVPDAVAWYERWGVPLRPDVVVLAAFLANDLRDASPQAGVEVVDGELVVAGERGGLRRWIYYHSHAFRLLKSSLLEGPLRPRLGLGEPWARSERRLELALYGTALPAELAAGAEATATAIDRFAATARGEGARPLALLVPSLPQVDPAHWLALHQQLGVDLAGQDRRRPNRLFRELFERRDIPVVDATDALAAAVARGEAVYHPLDQHLTARGYDLLARELLAALAAAESTPAVTRR